MAYLKKNQPCYVVIVEEPDYIYCAGVSLHKSGAEDYCAMVEQSMRDHGWELVSVEDNWNRGDYTSHWQLYGEWAHIRMQISALKQ